MSFVRPETGRTLNCRIRRVMTFKRQTLTERVSLAPQTPPASSLRRRGRLLRRLPTARYRTVRGTNAGQVLLDIEKAARSPSLLSRYPRAQHDGDLSAPPSCTGSLLRRSSFFTISDPAIKVAPCRGFLRLNQHLPGIRLRSSHQPRGPAAHNTQPKIAPMGDPCSPSLEGPRKNSGHRRTMHCESGPFRYDAFDEEKSTAQLCRSCGLAVRLGSAAQAGLKQATAINLVE